MRARMTYVSNNNRDRVEGEKRASVKRTRRNELLEIIIVKIRSTFLSAVRIVFQRYLKNVRHAR